MVTTLATIEMALGLVPGAAQTEAPTPSPDAAVLAHFKRALAAVGVSAAVPAAWLDALGGLDAKPQNNPRAATCSDARPYQLDGGRLADAIINTEAGLHYARGPEEYPLADVQVARSELWGCAPDPTLPMRTVGVRTDGSPVRIFADVPQARLLDLVHPDHRELAAEAMRRALGSRIVPGIVVHALLAVRARMEAEPYARNGLAYALGAAGEAQGVRDRSRCWGRCLDEIWLAPDGRTYRDIHGGGPCGSWRCGTCRDRLVAEWRGRISRQVAADLEAAEHNHYALINLTVDPRDWVTRAEAALGASSSQQGPWRRWIEGMRRRYPDLAYLRVVEWTRDGEGWPHITLLVRSRMLIEAMVADAGVESLMALRERVAEIDGDNRTRKAEGRRQRPMPHARVTREIRELAVQSGYGRQCYVAPVTAPKSIVYEVMKARQVDDSMPVGLRRVTASGTHGDGRETTFFRAGAAAVAGDGLRATVEAPDAVEPPSVEAVVEPPALIEPHAVEPPDLPRDLPDDLTTEADPPSRPPGAILVSRTIYRAPPATVIAALARAGDPHQGWAVTDLGLDLEDAEHPIERVSAAAQVPHDRTGLVPRLQDARGALAALTVVGVRVPDPVLAELDRRIAAAVARVEAAASHIRGLALCLGITSPSIPQDPDAAEHLWAALDYQERIARAVRLQTMADYRLAA